MVKIDQTLSHVTRKQSSRPTQKDVTKFDVGTLTPEEIEKKTTDLFEKKDGFFYCLACDYKIQYESKMRRHIEVHFEGLSYTCTLCNKEFRSKNSLNKHRSTIH